MVACNNSSDKKADVAKDSVNNLMNNMQDSTNKMIGNIKDSVKKMN